MANRSAHTLNGGGSVLLLIIAGESECITCERGPSPGTSSRKTAPIACVGPAAFALHWQPGEGGCHIDQAPGVRYQGKVWPSWTAAKGFGDPSVNGASNQHIPSQQQGLVAYGGAQECNCRCANISSCVGYTYLGASQECWLHSYVAFYSDPATTFTTANGATVQVANGTVIARVVTGEPWPLCSELAITKPNELPVLSGFLEISDISKAAVSGPVTHYRCNQACGSDPACVAYTWRGKEVNASSACTLWSEASGGLQTAGNVTGLGTTSAPLQSCQELKGLAGPVPAPAPTFPPLPPAPPPHLGSCGIDAAPGIRFRDAVIKGWVRAIGAGDRNTDTFLDTFSHRYIPTVKQGTVVATAAECNCLCASLDPPVCVAYTFLGDSKECWLMSYAELFWNPAKKYAVTANDTLVPVGPGTVVGRLITGREWPRCASEGLLGFFQSALAKKGSARIRSSVRGLVSQGQCNKACGEDPYCVAYGWTTTKSIFRTCTLYSEAAGGTVNSPMRIVAPLQTCVEYLDEGFCKIDPTPGIRYLGKVWSGWQPVKGLSAVRFDDFSHQFIPDTQQGLRTPGGVAECNCRCASIPVCVGYTFIDGSCWLHSWVQLYNDPVTTYKDPTTGMTKDVPSDAVLGRVITRITSEECTYMDFYDHDVIVKSGSARMRTATSFSSTASSCMVKCWSDPACVAISWRSALPADPAMCTLYSEARGGLQGVTFNDTVAYVAPLQSCPQLQDGPIAPRPAPLAHPPAHPPPSPATKGELPVPRQPPGAEPPPPPYQEPQGAGGSGSGTLTAAAVGAVAGVLLLSVLLVAWWRRRAPRSGIKLEVVHTEGADGAHMDISGLCRGEPFCQSTAREYMWQMEPLDPYTACAVEANINDRQLDAMLRDAGDMPGALPPVVELSKEDMQKQIKLLHNGLLGKGGTAVVFQCVWPECFGPNAVLAAKLLKDSHEVDPLVLQSFTCEASVLATTEHPCVVRLYGYCLEPPCVCLILELLPHSLKDLIHGRPQPQLPSPPASQPKASMAMREHMQTGTGTSSISLSAHAASSTPCRPASTSTSLVQDSSLGSRPMAVTGLFNAAARGEHVAVEFVSPGTTLSTGANDVEGMTSSGLLAAPPRQAGNAFDAAQARAAREPLLGVNKGAPSFVQPELDASSTAQGSSPLTMLRVLQISTDIAAGLAYLHDRPVLGTSGSISHAVITKQNTHTSLPQSSFKIVHRDLKPANILMNSQGCAEISDFGLARRVANITLNTEHLGAGTLPYMAPELLSGAHAGAYKMAPTSRVDIYSLSMIMWEMLSGSAPWSNRNEVAIISAVIRNQRPELPRADKDADSPAPTSIEALPASLSALPEFNSIIRQCWNSRDLRRPTAGAVYCMLRELLGKYGAAAPESDALLQSMGRTPSP